MNCPATHPVHHFSHYWQEINCLPGGFWSQDLYTYYTGYCSAPACNFFDVVPPENGWYSCTAQGYEGLELNLFNYYFDRYSSRQYFINLSIDFEKYYKLSAIVQFII
jgi:hypothetical protein